MSKIVQLGEVLLDIPIFGNILSSVAKKERGIARNLGGKIIDKQIVMFDKEYIKGSDITLTKKWNKRYYKSNWVLKK